MPYEADDYLSRHVQTSGIDLGSKIAELVALVAPPDSPNTPLYRDMLTTVVRMAQADRNRWDAKIMLQTLRETNVLSDETVAALNTAVDKFKLEFQTGEGKPLASVGREEFQAIDEGDVNQEKIVKGRR